MSEVSRQSAVRIIVVGMILTIVASVAYVVIARVTVDERDPLPQVQQLVKQTTTASAAPSPGPTPTKSEEEVAVAAAMEVPQRYFDIQADVRSDPNEALEKLEAFEQVAAGPLLDQAKTDASNMPYTGFVQNGAVAVTSANVISVDLETRGGSQQTPPVVVIHVCWDRTTAKYTRNGEPWEPADEILSSEWEIRNPQYPARDGWRAWNVEESDLPC